MRNLSHVGPVVNQHVQAIATVDGDFQPPNLATFTTLPFPPQTLEFIPRLATVTSRSPRKQPLADTKQISVFKKVTQSPYPTYPPPSSSRFSNGANTTRTTRSLLPIQTIPTIHEERSAILESGIRSESSLTGRGPSR